jgi:hypothetical protein
LKVVRTDRGRVHFQSVLSFCSEGGIKHYTTTPYSP